MNFFGLNKMIEVFRSRQSALVSLEQLLACMPNLSRSRAEKFIGALNETLRRYGIDTPLRIVHFLSQVGHESGSFYYLEELASGEAYEGRRSLGNVKRGDGKRFKGRGLIQLTGRANYRAYGAYIGKDLESQPEIVATLPLAVDVAGWYWMTKKLNQLADADEFEKITKKINGGTNGISDRASRLTRAKKVLSVK